MRVNVRALSVSAVKNPDAAERFQTGLIAAGLVLPASLVAVLMACGNSGGGGRAAGADRGENQDDPAFMYGDLQAMWSRGRRAPRPQPLGTCDPTVSDFFDRQDRKKRRLGRSSGSRRATDRAAEVVGAAAAAVETETPGHHLLRIVKNGNDVCAVGQWLKAEQNKSLENAAKFAVMKQLRGKPLQKIIKQENWDPLMRTFLDTEVKDEAGKTALIWAASQLGYNEIVKQLLEHGANVEAQDEEGRTALSWAAERCHSNGVSQLVDHGAELDVQDGEGKTALIRATSLSLNPHTRMVKGREFIVDLLLKRGANLWIRDNYGRRARDYPSKGNRVLELLRKAEENQEEKGDED